MIARKSIPANYFLLSLTLALVGLFAYYAALAQTFTPPEPTDAEIAKSGITFPITELGNCSSKSECRDYCNKTENMSTCIAFARSHGLMTKDEADQADKFREKITAGGPGGCRSPLECETYCNNVTHIKECLAFAEREGFTDPEIDEAKKIAAYLDSGGKMPGGCTSKESCMKYCGDFSHARECFEFATSAGLAQEGFEDEDFGERPPSPEQFKKLIEFVESGETPGRCRSKNECESYCRDSSHFEECITFGQKIGFVSEKEAEIARKIGGKGPGNCDSHKSCTEYCNNPANQEVCFKFAEEHGLIGENELKQAKEGFVRLRQGLEHAPPEAKACLESVVGPNIIEDIQSGKLAPGPEIGNRVRGCFEKFGHNSNPGKAFGDAPPQVISCVKEKLGDVFQKIVSGEALPTPEMGDAFRVCFQKFEFERGGFGGPGFTGPGSEGGPPDISSFVKTAPPDIKLCLKDKVGEDVSGLLADPASGESLREALHGCFKEFKPPEYKFNKEEGVFESKFEGGGFIEKVPSEIQECVAEKAGRDFLERALRGEIPRYEIEPIMSECFKSSRIIPGGENGDHKNGEIPPDYLRGLPPEVAECVKAGLPSGGDVRFLIESCFKKLGGGTFPPPGPQPEPGPSPVPQPTICPAMPTVDSCPPGSRKEVAYSSPECGTYYTCVPDSSSGSGDATHVGSTETYGCYDITSCEKLCFDSGSPAYTSETCIKFRDSRSGTTIEPTAQPPPPPPTTEYPQQYQEPYHQEQYDGQQYQVPPSEPIPSPTPTTKPAPTTSRNRILRFLGSIIDLLFR